MAEELRPEPPRAANEQGKITEEGVAAYTRLTWPPEAPPQLQSAPPHWTAVALSTLRSDRTAWLGMLDQRMVDTMIAPLLPHDRRPWAAGPAPRPGQYYLKRRLADCDVVAMSIHDGNRLLVEVARAWDPTDKRFYGRGLELVRFDDADAPPFYLGKPSGFHDALPHRDRTRPHLAVFDNDGQRWEVGLYGCASPTEANLKIFRPGYDQRLDLFFTHQDSVYLGGLTFDSSGMPFALMTDRRCAAWIWRLDGNDTPAIWPVEGELVVDQHQLHMFAKGIIASSDGKLLVWGSHGFQVHCAATGARLVRFMINALPALIATINHMPPAISAELTADGSLALLTADHRLFRLANHLRGDC
jgi:hypothetical protein